MTTTNEQAMAEGYEQLAKDPEFIAEQTRRRERRIRNRRNTKDVDGNPVQGMWNVELLSSEPYERPYSQSVGLFSTLADAERYCDALEDAIHEAKSKEQNVSESNWCYIDFIPLGDADTSFHNLYLVATNRDTADSDREIESVTAVRYNSKRLAEALAESTQIAAVWNDKSLAVVDNSTGEILPSSVFPDLEWIEYEDEPKMGYFDGSETFITTDPKNVILKHP